MNARTDRFPLVDSLRGIAALMVVVTHVTWFSATVPGDAPLWPYLSRLESGVAVFFVISGFLLYRPFVARRPLPLATYAWRRFLRIVPAFWVALTVIAIWRGVDQLFTPREVAINYGFLQLYRGASPFNVIPQGWSMCVEVAFYAALPLWAWLVRRYARSAVWAVVALIAAGLAYNVALVHTVDITGLGPSALLAALPGFADTLGLGMLLAVVSVTRRDDLPRPLAFLARHPAVCLIIAAAALWLPAKHIVLTGPSFHYSAAQYLERHVLNAIVGAALLIPCVFGDAREGVTRRVLGSSALRYVGLVSYSLYLYHLAVITQLRDWGVHSVPLAYTLAFAGSVVVASVSYYAVERPALSLKRLVGPPPDQAREEALAEPAPVKV